MGVVITVASVTIESATTPRAPSKAEPREATATVRWAQRSRLISSAKRFARLQHADLPLPLRFMCHSKERADDLSSPNPLTCHKYSHAGPC